MLTDEVAAVARELAAHRFREGLAGDLHLDGRDEVIPRDERRVDVGHAELERLTRGGAIRRVVVGFLDHRAPRLARHGDDRGCEKGERSEASPHHGPF
jgi:hypothetical protein